MADIAMIIAGVGVAQPPREANEANALRLQSHSLPVDVDHHSVKRAGEATVAVGVGDDGCMS